MGIFMLRTTWVHEYMAIFVKIDRHRTSGRSCGGAEVFCSLQVSSGGLLFLASL